MYDLKTRLLSAGMGMIACAMLLPAAQAQRMRGRGPMPMMPRTAGMGMPRMMMNTPLMGRPMAFPAIGMGFGSSANPFLARRMGSNFSSRSSGMGGSGGSGSGGANSGSYGGAFNDGLDPDYSLNPYSYSGFGIAGANLDPYATASSELDEGLERDFSRRASATREHVNRVRAARMRQIFDDSMYEGGYRLTNTDRRLIDRVSKEGFRADDLDHVERIIKQLHARLDATGRDLSVSDYMRVRRLLYDLDAALDAGYQHDMHNPFNLAY
jgi:hypothetical protein